MTTENDRPAAAREFVERSAMTFAEWGFPRAAARVLMTLMTVDDPVLTSAELAERLVISPAAVSGAVRYLIRLGIVERRPVPGSRKDAYRLRSDHWYASTATVGGVYASLAALAESGQQALGDQSPAADRISEMRDYFAFIASEIDDLNERWRQRQK